MFKFQIDKRGLVGNLLCRNCFLGVFYARGKAEGYKPYCGSNFY